MDTTHLLKTSKGEIVGNRTAAQIENDRSFHQIALKILMESGTNWPMHSLCVMKRNALARVLYLHDLYQKILLVPGVVCEFGVHWGAGLATLLNLRSLLEPFNHSRMLYGFDTFQGFAGVCSQDGNQAQDGDYQTEDGYERVLEQILAYHESISPFPEQRKFGVIKGDASQTVKIWLDQSPHAIIAMAIFDMDIYQPTHDVLTAIQPRLTKGSVLVFDELNCPFFPGETSAVADVLGLNNLKLQRHPLQPYCAWAVI